MPGATFGETIVDAITLLKQDHKAVKALFAEFDKAAKAKDPARSEIVAKIIAELSAHIAVEESIFYPAVREEAPGIDAEILESYEEHHVVSWLCQELLDMNAAAERYDAKVTVLKENVTHHVKEEETEWFPEVRAELSRKRLAELGELLENAKKTAPRVPHPLVVVRR